MKDDVLTLLPHYRITFSLLFVSLKLSWMTTAYFVAVHAVFFVLSWMQVPALCYGLALLLVSHHDVFELDLLKVLFDNRGDHCYFISVVAFYWTVLRCLSFCMDHMSRAKEDTSAGDWPDYWKTLAYAVYLPPLFLGPVQNYEDFITSVDRTKPPITLREVYTCVAGVLRSAAHLLLMDLMCQYFYSSALNAAPHLVEKLDNTSLLGYGATLNVMFFLKYLIQYGVSGGCARIEGIHLPAPPKCVARGHLCSHFWRYFDHGLHLWIKKYVYLPIVGAKRSAMRRVMAIAMAFGCVWVWHSMTTAVTFWATLSFAGVALEVALEQIKRLNCCKRFDVKNMNPGWARFLKAAIGSPHYLLTIFACMFYLTNMEITTIFFKRVILGFPMPLIPLLVSLYFGAYASQDVMEWESSAAEKSRVQ
ncbi:protein-cysteine N-palmitoyltransferase Rasp-like [Amblyomma americanum]